MPLWRIFHPPALFSTQDKQGLATAITAIYTNSPNVRFPAFYVNVLFLELSPASFFVGGAPQDNFVRIAIEHIAYNFDTSKRALEDAEKMRWFMSRAEACIRPFVKEKGADWELHAAQTERELWRVQGLRAPAVGSEAENVWRETGRPVPWEGMDDFGGTVVDSMNVHMDGLDGHAHEDANGHSK